MRRAQDDEESKWKGQTIGQARRETTQIVAADILWALDY